jgi:DNA-binding beta-propeller fold protein YncE
MAFAARLRQVAMVDLPGQPGFDSVAIANGALLVAHSAADTVDILDLTKRHVIAQVKHVRGASGIAVDDKNSRVYLSAPDGHSIVVISSKTWDVDGVIPVQSQVEHILYVPANNRLYLANSRDQSIAYIDFADKNAVHKLDAGGMPERLVFDPTKSLIYATLQDKHSVAAYDLDLKPVSLWVLKASQPTGMSIDANARRLYVAVRYAVVTLDADSGTELSRTGAPAGVDSLWLDQPSGTLYAAAGGVVCIMKTRSGGLTLESELNVDVKGQSLAYDPQTKLIYLPGGREGRSKLLIMKEVDSNAVATFQAKHGKASAEGQ